MADGLLSGLESFGFGGLENMNLFEDESKKSAPQGEEKAAPTVSEKDFLLDKTIECPVCDSKFKYRALKASAAKLIGTDNDLRPRHEGIDVSKYDVIMCPMCGYTALTRFFPGILNLQRQKVREKICANFKVRPGAPETYTYDEAIDNYKMALLNAVVKGAKASEKAYICLKTSWMYRGKAEEIGESDPEYKNVKANEFEFTKNAYEGFVSAVSTENYPMCGMDETTVDYLLANLANMTGHIDVCSKLIAKLLGSPTASPRIKDKTRDLKEEVLKKIKNKQ